MRRRSFHCSPQRARRARAFTLIEMLVATAVMVTILFLVFSVITQATNVWKRSSNKLEAFKSARAGFDLVTRNLSQATLNSYLDYDSATSPTRYMRKSELKFFIGPTGTSGTPGTPNTGEAVFFQAPLGYTLNSASAGSLDALLNTCGYYVQFTTNSSMPNHVSPSANPYRYRLMQLLVPMENNTIYTASGNAWFNGVSTKAVPVADNIIAMIIRPQDPASTPVDLTSNFTYDSTLNASNSTQPVTAHQLPPVVQVTVVAIDEVSAARLTQGSTPPGAITAALAGKFSTTTSYDKDLTDLESSLVAAGIDCRIFTSAVPIRESKWTK